MKKLLYYIMLVVFTSITVVACKEKGNENETESNSGLAADKAETAMNDVYQCPMDCENGKTYDKKGSCPVCNMNLKKVEKEGDHTEHDKDAKHEHEKNEEGDEHSHD